MKWSMTKATLGVTCAGLAGFAATAHAQSSVTLYGIVDAGVEYVNHASKDGGATRLVSGGKNTSRWGLRGVEDLGGGLKAVFQLESGINIANGQFDDSTGAIFDRRATIGLKNRFGQITLGRNFTTTYDYMLQFDPMGYAPNYSWATSSTATGGRENGPFAVVATFDRQNGANDSVTPADTTNYIQGIHAGLSYDFGAVKAMAGYRNYRRTFHTAAPALRSDMYWVGGQYDVTPFFSLFAAVYHQDIKDASDADPTLFSLRAQYALSKRTVLYMAGGYAMARHDNAVSLSRDLTGAADTQTGVTAGIQHRF
jgi:predicted porin